MVTDERETVAHVPRVDVGSGPFRHVRQDRGDARLGPFERHAVADSHNARSTVPDQVVGLNVAERHAARRPEVPHAPSLDQDAPGQQDEQGRCDHLSPRPAEAGPAIDCECDDRRRDQVVRDRANQRCRREAQPEECAPPQGTAAELRHGAPRGQHKCQREDRLAEEELAVDERQRVEDQECRGCQCGARCREPGAQAVEQEHRAGAQSHLHDDHNISALAEKAVDARRGRAGTPGCAASPVRTPGPARRRTVRSRRARVRVSRSSPCHRSQHAGESTCQMTAKAASFSASDRPTRHARTR